MRFGDLSVFRAGPDGFTPEAAEAVIRRAVELHERESQALSVDELKQSLADLGVSPEAVEHAAMEVRQELSAMPKKARLPSQVVIPVVSAVILLVPGVALMVYAWRVPVLPWWVALPLGALWTWAIGGTVVQDLRKWWRTRHLRAES